MTVVKKATSTMPVSRQIRYLSESRESWKERALEKQEQVRFLSQKNLDLAGSREQWKAKALKEKERVKQLEKEIEKLKKKIGKLQNLSLVKKSP